jgi:hypothetical protein
MQALKAKAQPTRRNAFKKGFGSGPQPFEGADKRAPGELRDEEFF